MYNDPEYFSEEEKMEIDKIANAIKTASSEESTFFNDTVTALLEAVKIEKGNVKLTERKGMPAPTYYVAKNDTEDEMKSENKNNPRGSSWSDLEKELFTQEEITESNARVAAINEAIKAKEKTK